MKDKPAKGIFFNGNDIQVLEGSVYAPKKGLIDIVPPYGIFSSVPEPSSTLVSQHSIRRQGSDEDLLRVDSMGDGYFSSYWAGKPTVAQFLQQTEVFFTQFEEVVANNLKPRLRLIFFADGALPTEVFEFDRPLVEEQIIVDSEVYGEEDLWMIRIDSPVGGFTFELDDEIVGFISEDHYSNPVALAQAAQAWTRFVVATHQGIDEAPVARLTKEFPQLRDSAKA